MDEFSLYVLDIVNNSTRAGARNIRIFLREEGEDLYFTVEDDGCGMSEEQLARLRDPFFTTRKTRKVGLGVPFLVMLAEMTGGWVKIASKQAAGEGEDHGTKLEAKFGLHHVDFLPLGDLCGTVTTLIQGAPDTDFLYLHTRGEKQVRLDTKELRQVLGDLSLAEPEVLAWIRENLAEQYEQMNQV